MASHWCKVASHWCRVASHWCRVESCRRKVSSQKQANSTTTKSQGIPSLQGDSHTATYNSSYNTSYINSWVIVRGRRDCCMNVRVEKKDLYNNRCCSGYRHVVCTLQRNLFCKDILELIKQVFEGITYKNIPDVETWIATMMRMTVEDWDRHHDVDNASTGCEILWNLDL